MKYEKLYEYIPYLEGSVNVVLQRKGGIVGTEYDDKFLKFIGDVSSTDIPDYAGYYKSEMRRVSAHDILTCDTNTVKALLAHYVRAERFCDGAWQSAVRKGYFLALLKRLRELVN